MGVNPSLASARPIHFVGVSSHRIVVLVFLDKGLETILIQFFIVMLCEMRHLCPVDSHCNRFPYLYFMRIYDGTNMMDGSDSKVYFEHLARC